MDVNEIKKVLRKINTNPSAATAEELEKAADYYFDEYQAAETERNKSIYIGQAAYHGSWSVKRGNYNKESIEKFIRFHEIDSQTSNPSDTTIKDLQELRDILNEIKTK